MAYQPETDNDGVIKPGLYATPMRNLTENKGLLDKKGMLYAGTGTSKEFVCGVKDNKDIKISVPVTTAINPSDAAEGSVLIKDSTKDGGWTVGQVGTAGIAAGAVTSEQTHFEDKITIYPSNPTNGPQPTVISLPFAPVGSFQQVNLRLPSSSGQLINQDYVDDQKFASQIPKTTLAYGEYSTRDMALDYGQSVTFTVTIIGATHENGGDTSGIIESVKKGTPPYGDDENAIWLRDGRVVSYTDTTVTLSFTNRGSSTVYQVPWGINVDYVQPAYMALNLAPSADVRVSSLTVGNGEEYQVTIDRDGIGYTESSHNTSGLLSFPSRTISTSETLATLNNLPFYPDGMKTGYIDEVVLGGNSYYIRLDDATKMTINPGNDNLQLMTVMGAELIVSSTGTKYGFCLCEQETYSRVCALLISIDSSTHKLVVKLAPFATSGAAMVVSYTNNPAWTITGGKFYYKELQ